ncbi:hypothetical protein D9M71_822600 [compost metagenome]
MLRQLLAIDRSLRRQWMPDAAYRDHFDAAQHSPFERLGNLIVVKQQTEIGPALHQLARHIALGTAR